MLMIDDTDETTYATQDKTNGNTCYGTPNTHPLTHSLARPGHVLSITSPEFFVAIALGLHNPNTAWRSGRERGQDRAPPESTTAFFHWHLTRTAARWIDVAVPTHWCKELAIRVPPALRDQLLHYLHAHTTNATPTDT